MLLPRVERWPRQGRRKGFKMGEHRRARRLHCLEMGAHSSLATSGSAAHMGPEQCECVPAKIKKVLIWRLKTRVSAMHVIH